jgi:hypothetical protein
MIIKQILARVYVNDMNSAIDFNEKLTNEKCADRFEYKQAGLEIARVNSILLIAGTDKALEPFKRTSATFLVDSVFEYRDFLKQNGALILNDTKQVPTGFNMIIQHKDGIIIEYVEHKKII